MLFRFWQKSYHRALLEELLHKHAHFLGGKILDVGSKNRRYDHLLEGKVTAVDLVADRELDVEYGNLEKGLKYPAESFDGILCLEVFEYLEKYQFAAQEIHRLLKPGGTALVSIPFMYAEHEDKLRFTAPYALEAFKEFEEIKLTKVGNGRVVIWDILRKKVKRVPNKLLRYFGLALLIPGLLALTFLRLDKAQDDMYSGIFLILRR